MQSFTEFSFYTDKKDGYWGYLRITNAKELKELIDLIGEDALNNSVMLPPRRRTPLMDETLFRENDFDAGPDKTRFSEWFKPS